MCANRLASAYAKLLVRLTAQKFDGTTPQLRANILAFYSDLSLPIETRKARHTGTLFWPILTN